MNRRLTLILFIVLVGGCIAAFIYYKKNYFPKYSWEEDYRRNSEQPYGLNLFHNVIKKQSAKTNILANRSYFELDTSRNSNYIFIGDEFWMDSSNVSSVLKFVARGNNALICSNNTPFDVLVNFVPVGDTLQHFSQQRDSIVNISYAKGLVPYNNKREFFKMYYKDTFTYNWGVYGKRYFNDTLQNYRFKALAYLNDSNITAFTIAHGKGKITIHANPILFTNFYMVRQSGFEHANNFLAQLNNGTSYWDEPSYANNNSSHSSGSHNNPLKFLFSHPYLKWAWYLFLVTVLLYLIFRSKREQRVIPLLPVNTNASIEYIKAIGTLYFQNKGHNHIATEMYIIFLSEVRSRYNISTDMPENDLIDQLSVRSGIDKSVLFYLFKLFKEAQQNSDASSDTLINLYNSIENYHKKRK